MKELCCQFGPQGALAGIVTEPIGTARPSAVALVTAGLTPKSGPFRLYAELARRLAADGFRTLRFDLDGIGDSARAYEGYPLERRTGLEIAAAVDFLSQRYQIEGVVLGGLCSGAEDSFRYAERDERVRRVFMIDPFAYRTRGFWWRHLRYRAQRRLLRAAGLYRPAPARGGRALVNYQRMALPESTRILRALLKRDVRLHFIYTGGMLAYFNHERQLQAMFPDVELGASVQLDYLRHLDHTQLLEADRRTLITAIAQRLVLE